MFLSWLKNNKTIFLSALLAVASRIYFSYQPGHSFDIGTFHAWGRTLIELGPSTLYDSVWTDYLPLPLYLLGAVKAISTHLTVGFETTLKLSLSALELLLIFLLSKNVSKKYKTSLTVLLLANPAFIINTALWGQIDTIVGLLIALSFLLVKKDKVVSGLIFGVALALKPISILALPILLLRIKKPLKDHIKWGLSVGLPLYFSAVPVTFPKGQAVLETLISPVKFIFERTIYQTSMYPYTTINAFNFWAIKGNNWISDSTSVLGITPHTLGIIMFLVLTLPLIKKSLGNVSLYKLAGASSLIFLSFYTFTTRMHERHMIFALPILALAALKDKTTKYAYIFLSFLNGLNMLFALSWLNNNQTWPTSINMRIGISIATVVSVLLLYVKHNNLSLKNYTSHISKNKTLIAILALATLLRLVTLGNPKIMMFDEVYHAFTAKEMLNNNPMAWEWWNNPPEGYAYEWTHPPVAKYGMVLGMIIFGENSFGWRVGSAIMGILAVLLMFKITRKLLGKKAATIAAFLLSLSGLHLVQSRIAMNDIYMLTLFMGSFLYALNGKWKHTSVLFGLSLASKWSALYGLLPLSFIFVKEYGVNIKSILSAVRFILISLIVYVLIYTPFFLSGHTHLDFLELKKQMWYYHTNLKATHSYQSEPWQWLLAERPVWYHVSYQEHIRSNIYAHLNPLIAWGGLVALVATFIKRVKKLTLPVLSYFAFTLPWIISPRIMFMYHYLPGITFLIIPLSYWISKLKKEHRSVTLALILASLILLLPMYIGIPMPQQYWNTLFSVFPSWK